MLAIPSVGHAGFQFTGPTTEPQAPQVGGLLPTPDSAPMPAVPPAPVMQQNLSVPQSIAPASITQSAPPSPEQTSAQGQSGISWNTQQNAPVTTSLQAGQYDLAVGFGNELPLVTALEQVIPDGYTYVMDPGLSVGQKVSWQGGQPWPKVLDEMVRSLGLQSEVQGNVVRITGQSTLADRLPEPPVNNANRPQQIAAYAPPATSSSVVMSDAPQQAPVPLLSPQTSQPLAPYPYTPMTVPLTNQIFQEPQAHTVAALSNETARIEEKEKSIVPDVTTGQWTALSGTSLKTVLEDWSNIEGVDLFWSSDYDYPLVGDVNISGTYEEAVESLLEGFADAKPKPVGRLHPNLPHGPAVLLIETGRVTE